MSRRLIFGMIALTALAVALAIVLVTRAGDVDDIQAEMVGDVEEALEGMAPGEMPAQAEALLATDRPWRASRVMRRYMEQVSDPPADHRLLAARAEAGWEAWPEVRTLLTGVPSLETYENGLGLYLLGRAHDHAGEPAQAVETYRAFLALSPPAGTLEDERAAARLRLGLALVRAGDRSAARQELQPTETRLGDAAQWLRLLEADALAQAGDTAAVRAAVAGLDSGIQGLRAWRARIAAARAAGDVAGARALANRARAWAGTDGTRAEFLVAAARAAIEMGDVAAGRSALRAAIDLQPAGGPGRAAAELLREGQMTPEDELAVARVNSAQGLHEEAAEGYERWLQSGQGSAAQRREVHMEHANALFYAQQYDQVEAALRPIAGQIRARLLLGRTEAHRDRPAEAARIYQTIAQEMPRSGTGTQALFLAASAWHDANDPDRAREIYRQVVARYPGSRQMGLALMRLAGIAYNEGDYAQAARLWDQYRTSYPGGTSALPATYWAARAREEAGDSAGAAALYQNIRQRQRDSYYALRSSERLGVPFWPLPMSASPADDLSANRRVAAWMDGIDLLRNAGFPDEASAQADRVVASAGSDRATLYALAEALAERGYSQRAIRLGIRLQGSGQPNQRLLRILYPFPYRTLITEEARDRGFDPFVAAALIRQESMFEQRITSHVGARGLMQIMPATGRMLAEAVGMDRWDAEMLYHPEINVHLGTRYLARHMENYDDSLPAVFSAYNAGSHRVEWWMEWPEYGNDELFTERIPFQETRDYVKILTRNLELYRGLYGDGTPGG